MAYEILVFLFHNKACKPDFIFNVRIQKGKSINFYKNNASTITESKKGNLK